ncbi:hypothetical protein [Nocardia nova]|uniref:hypothetical protein n=1 Tax=Nocardia nova TaxID=37330 RepID=UPI0033D7D49D
MGETAIRNADGQHIKIGTLVELTDLRYDQRDQVHGTAADYWAATNWQGALFRFPFPNEDTIPPGGFDDPDRGLRIDGWTIPTDWDIRHHTVQFKARQGYLVSLPCPEAHPDQTFGPGKAGIHRNGFTGSLFLTAQRLRRDDDGIMHLVPILRCACETVFNIGTDLATFESLAATLRAEADRWQHDSESRANMLHTVADRVMSGYNLAQD